MTWPVTGLGPAGTPRRPNPPTTTWPSSSAASSSPPDFAVHALSRPPRKKPGPSSRPGPPPGLDQQKLRNTRVKAAAGNETDATRAPVRFGGANPEQTTCERPSRPNTHEHDHAAQAARDGTRRHQPRARIRVRDEEVAQRLAVAEVGLE